MNRKNAIYCDSQDEEKYIEGMKIIPLSTTDLRAIIMYDLKYRVLYKHFDKAFQNASGHPLSWYREFVNIDKSFAQIINKTYAGEQPLHFLSLHTIALLSIIVKMMGNLKSGALCSLCFLFG